MKFRKFLERIKFQRLPKKICKITCCFHGDRPWAPADGPRTGWPLPRRWTMASGTLPGRWSSRGGGRARWRRILGARALWDAEWTSKFDKPRCLTMGNNAWLQQGGAGTVGTSQYQEVKIIVSNPKVDKSTWRWPWQAQYSPVAVAVAGTAFVICHLSGHDTWQAQ